MENDGIITLNERIDIESLQKIIYNFDSLKHNFEKKEFKSKGYDIEILKGILKKYLNSKKKSDEIQYGFVGKLKHGRRFSKSCSLQSLCKKIRHTISGDIYYDIDMKNAHPTILSQYCGKNEISCQKLDEYVNDRDGVINSLVKEYPDVCYDEIKTLLLTILNGGGEHEVEGMNQWLLDYYYEMKSVREKVCKKNPELVKRAKKRKETNIDGAATNYLMCVIEDEILQSIYKFCKDVNVDVGALVFDGLMVYRDSHYFTEHSVDDFLQLARDFVKKQTGWDIILVEKPMKSGLDLSDLTCEDEIEMVVYNDDYVLSDEEIEKYVWTDFYMESRGIFQSKSHLFSFFKTRFPYVCNKLNIGEGLYVKKETLENKMNLVKGRWGVLFSHATPDGKVNVYKMIELIEGTGIPTYSELCYKPKNDILSHQFNTWTKLKSDNNETRKSDVNLLLDFLREIICNNSDEMYKYLISWIRRICKTPWQKTQTVLLFHSKQGSGKGSFVNWMIQWLFGINNSAYASINTITQKHNAILANKIFMGIDELPTVEKQFHNLFDTLKGIITDPYLTVEPKGIEPYTIDNLCNFIFMTNNKHSVKLEQSDRRYVVFEINEKRIGDFEYWSYAHKEIFTEDMANTFFTYLVNIEDDNPLVVDLRKIPSSRLREIMKEMSLNNIECFIKDVRERVGIANIKFTLYDAKTVRDGYGNNVLETTDICNHPDYKDGETFIISKKDLYDSYCFWCANNGEKPSKLKYLSNHLEEVRMGKNRDRCFKV